MTEIHEVGFEFHIVEVKCKNPEKIMFSVYLNFKRLNEWTTSFDQALLVALAAKYNHGTDAAFYAARVLGIVDKEETK